MREIARKEMIDQAIARTYTRLSFYTGSKADMARGLICDKDAHDKEKALLDKLVKVRKSHDR